MTYRDIAKKQLIVDEGMKFYPYRDTVGKLTIGVGRNLEDRGITSDEALYLLDNDLAIAEKDAKALFPTFERLSEARKAVLLNMALNLGRDRLAGFRRFREAVEAEAWEQAAAEMLDSRWATQVKGRADRLAKQMREG